MAKAAVHAAVATGQLACFRIRSRPGTRGAIRISREQLRDWLEECTNEPRGRGQGPAPKPPAEFTVLGADRLREAWGRTDGGRRTGLYRREGVDVGP